MVTTAYRRILSRCLGEAALHFHHSVTGRNLTYRDNLVVRRTSREPRHFLSLVS